LIVEINIIEDIFNFIMKFLSNLSLQKSVVVFFLLIILILIIFTLIL